jgi:hypothetical protein
VRYRIGKLTLIGEFLLPSNGHTKGLPSSSAIRGPQNPKPPSPQTDCLQAGLSAKPESSEQFSSIQHDSVSIVILSQYLSTSHDDSVSLVLLPYHSEVLPSGDSQSRAVRSGQSWVSHQLLSWQSRKALQIFEMLARSPGDGDTDGLPPFCNRETQIDRRS